MRVWDKMSHVLSQITMVKFYFPNILFVTNLHYVCMYETCNTVETSIVEVAY